MIDSQRNIGGYSKNNSCSSFTATRFLSPSLTLSLSLAKGQRHPKTRTRMGENNRNWLKRKKKKKSADRPKSASVPRHISIWPILFPFTPLPLLSSSPHIVAPYYPSSYPSPHLPTPDPPSTSPKRFLPLYPAWSCHDPCTLLITVLDLEFLSLFSRLLR